MHATRNIGTNFIFCGVFSTYQKAMEHLKSIEGPDDDAIYHLESYEIDNPEWEPCKYL